jgi:hypothetical protein
VEETESFGNMSIEISFGTLFLCEKSGPRKLLLQVNFPFDNRERFNRRERDD